MEKVGKKRSPRVFATLVEGEVEIAQRVHLEGSLSRMASEEVGDVEDVEDMETEMSPEREFCTRAAASVFLG